MCGKLLEGHWKIVRKCCEDGTVSPTGDQKGDPSGLPWKIEHEVKWRTVKTDRKSLATGEVGNRVAAIETDQQSICLQVWKGEPSNHDRNDSAKLGNKRKSERDDHSVLKTAHRSQQWSKCVRRTEASNGGNFVESKGQQWLKGER
jgi:hypothetical protein